MFINLMKQWVLAPLQHFRLFRNFVKQDFLSQFAASLGGILWLFITPAVQILIYYFIFTYLLPQRIDMASYGTDKFVIFLMVAMLPWFAFADAVSRSTGLLLEKAPLITKMMFPVHIVPWVGTLVPYIASSMGFFLFLVYLAWAGYLSLLWLMIPIVFLLQLLFTLGIVALLSGLCVFLRDLQHAVTLIVQIWFFMTPIIYPISVIPPEARTWFALNPMYHFVDLYREIILRNSFPMDSFLIALVASILSLLIGGWVFMRIKHAFGDVL